MRIAFLGLFLATLLLSTSSFARSVTDVLPLGGSTEGIVEAGRPSVVGVLIPAGATKVLIKYKLDSKSGLDPEFSLVRPDGTTLDAAALASAGAKVKVTTKSITVKNLPAGLGGLYKLVVAGRGDTSGSWALKTKGKPAKGPKLSESLGSTTQVDEYTVAVPDGALLTVKLGPASKSGLVPELEILTASGLPIDFDAFAKEKNGKTSVKKLPLPFFGEYTLRVRSGSGTGSYALSAKVKASPPRPDPARPFASAGPNVAAAPGTTAQLTGSGPGGASFSWERVSGDGPDLGSADSATPTFKAPVERGTHAFQLVVRVNGVASFADTVVVEVDQAPVAVAGPSRTVAPGAMVTLDGSGSLDVDGSDALAFSWRQVAGTNVALDGAETSAASFAAPGSAGVLAFELVVNDGFSDSVADRVLVGVDRDVADAGRPVVVAPQDAVYLSGLRTTAAGGTFAWTRVDSGPGTIAIAGAADPVAHFSAPRSIGVFRFRLTVDGDATAADDVTLIVAHGIANLEPLAATDPITTVGRGGSFALSALDSTDPDGNPMSFEWRQDTGTPVILGGSGSDRSATARDSDEILGFLLMAHDGRKYGAPDRATVVVGDPTAPVAHAGPDVAVEPGFARSLDGSESRQGRGTGSRVGPGRRCRAWTSSTSRRVTHSSTPRRSAR